MDLDNVHTESCTKCKFFVAKLCYKSSHDREFPRFLYKYKQNEHPKQK